MTDRFPPSFAVDLDPAARRPDPQLLVRAAPGAAVRLGPAGVAAVDALLAGAPIVDADAKAGTDTTPLVRLLLDAGIVQPRPTGTAFTEADVTVVIPARNAGRAIGDLVAAVAPLPVLVIDDGSTDETADAATTAGASVVRIPTSLGPAAARNRGVAEVTTPLVMFLDADCRPRRGWLAPLLAELDDPAVAAAAPRIVPLGSGGSRLARYEAARSVLDQGTRESSVGPDSALTLVPTAALLIRRHALASIGGLDRGLRFGEDQDLVHRLVAAGWRVRYQPRAEVAHDHRSAPSAFVRRRFGYGTPAARLARRHGRAHAAVRVPSPIAAALLLRDLASLGVAPDEARAVARATARRTVRTLGHAATRVWLPAALLAATRSRRAAALLGAALVARHAGDWRRRRPDVGLAPWVGLRLVDEGALAAGLWWGAVRNASLTPLLPAFSSRPALEASDGQLVDRVMWLP